MVRLLLQRFDVAHAPRLVEHSGLCALEAEHDEAMLIGAVCTQFDLCTTRYWPRSSLSIA